MNILIKRLPFILCFDLNSNDQGNLFFSVGSFDTSQLTEAKVAGFNMWDYELTVGQMNALTCETEGNLIATSQLQLGGTASYTYEDFDCGKYLEFIQSSLIDSLVK